MFFVPFGVVLDANVLFPPALRDTLLRAAEAGLYQVHWSDQILDEATRNMVARSRMTQEKADRLRARMNEAFPEARVTGYESIIAAMKNDEKDRHVVAVAVMAGAQVIVTQNLSDFRPLPEGVEAQSPTRFLSDLLDLDQELMVRILRQQASDMKKPPQTFDQLLDGLAITVPGFVEEVRAKLEDMHSS